MSSSNPYVGPRAFRAGENLPTRTREQRELTDLMIAERIFLLHAIWFGKTSLIKAGVVPLAREERVGGSRFQVVAVRIVLGLVGQGSQGLLRAPQKPLKPGTRRPIPTEIPRTKRHTPVYLLCLLKVRKTAGDQRRCA